MRGMTIRIPAVGAAPLPVPQAAVVNVPVQEVYQTPSIRVFTRQWCTVSGESPGQ